MKKFFAYVVSIIGVLGIVYYIVFFPDRTDYNFYVGLSQIISGIFAGSLTVLGVIWTLSSQEKSFKEERDRQKEQQKEQFRLENLPVFQYSSNCISKASDGIILNVDCEPNDTNLITIQLNLLLKNIGLRSAQHIFFGVVINGEIVSERSGKINSLIKPDQELETTFYFRIGNLHEERISNADETEIVLESNYSLKVIVFYDDLIGNHYMQELNGCITRNDSIENANGKISGIATACLSDSQEDGYKLIDDNFQYIVPQETIAYEERCKQEVTRLKEFKKIKGRDKIDKLVGEYFNNKFKNFDEYVKKTYNELRFGFGGSDILDYIKIEDNIYDVIMIVGHHINEKQCVIYQWTLRVNLNNNSVTKMNTTVKENTLPVSSFRKWKDKVNFSKFNLF